MARSAADSGIGTIAATPQPRSDFPDVRVDQPAEGVLLQVNADSLLGAGNSRRAARFARKLLTDGLAHAIAPTRTAGPLGGRNPACGGG
jgi:hypothetical protein